MERRGEIFQLAESGIHLGARVRGGLHFLATAIDGRTFHGRATPTPTEAGEALFISRFETPLYSQHGTFVFPERHLSLDDHEEVRKMILAGLTLAAAAALIGVRVHHHHKKTEDTSNAS